jgi:translation initiation factor IF-3
MKSAISEHQVKSLISTQVIGWSTLQTMLSNLTPVIMVNMKKEIKLANRYSLDLLMISMKKSAPVVKFGIR